jgi:perosamine synthetase
MERIEKVVERKRVNARIYGSLLEELDGITLPKEAPWARQVYWLYTVLIEDHFKFSRKRLIEELALGGIQAQPVFYPITNLPPYRNGRSQRFAVAEKISRQGVSLPSSPLLSADSIDRVCSVFRRIVQGQFQRRMRA